MDEKKIETADIFEETFIEMLLKKLLALLMLLTVAISAVNCFILPNNEWVLTAIVLLSLLALLGTLLLPLETFGEKIITLILFFIIIVHCIFLARLWI